MAFIIELQRLPRSANVTDIRQYFGGLSIPEGGVFVVGGENGKAFIKFSTHEDARRALQWDGGRLEGARVQLRTSSPVEMLWTVRNAGRHWDVGGSRRSRRSPLADMATGDGDGSRPRTVRVLDRQTSGRYAGTRRDGTVVSLTTGRRTDGLSMTYEWMADGNWFCARRNPTTTTTTTTRRC